jgi:hypothetical protein
MGITVNEHSLFDGSVIVSDVYINLRGIEVNKEDGRYTLSGLFSVWKSGKLVDNVYRRFVTTTPSSNVWGDLYQVYKEELVSAGKTVEDT